MPTKHKNIYQKLLSFRTLHEAWTEAKKGKRLKNEVLLFERSLESNLFALIDELNKGEYSTAGYKEFYVYEPKKRKIARLAKFRDRVIQQAVFNLLELIYEPIFIHNSFACRKGKGIHSGADKAQRMIRAVRRNKGIAYALKCDISKYFASIDHSILKSILRQKISDQSMLVLLDGIIDSYSDADGKGLPLGNLTSQIFANIYLNELDKMIKHELKEVYYIRYMDDFVILHSDKAHLKSLREIIENWLGCELALSTNNKTCIFPVRNSKGRSLDFLGYRITANTKKLRKRAISQLEKKVNLLHWQYADGLINFPQVRHSLASHMAHANHADSSAVINRIFKRPFRRTIDHISDIG